MTHENEPAITQPQPTPADGQPPAEGQTPPPAPAPNQQSAPQPAAAGPNPFASWARTFTMIFTGNPGLPWFAGSPSPAAPLQWLVASLVNGVASFLILLIYALTVGAKDAGTIILLLVLCPLVSVALIAVRALTHMGVAAMRGQKIPFVDAANIASIGWIAVLPTFVLGLLVAVAAHPVTIGLWGLGTVFAISLSELDQYITIARMGRFQKSAMMPYALMTLAYAFVLFLLLGLLWMLVWNSVVGSLNPYGSLLGGVDW